MSVLRGLMTGIILQSVGVE